MRLRLIAIGAALTASAAGAQQLPPDDSLIAFGRYTSVRERIIPGYAAKGLPVGPFTLTPTLDAVADYNDNLFALEEDEIDDVAFRLAPAVELNAVAARGRASISARGSIDRFASRTSENRTAFDAGAYGVRTFGQGTRARLIARYRTDRESRESQNVFTLTERPIRFDVATIAGGVSQRFNRVQVAVEAGITRSRFEDGRFAGGGVLDQDFRDNDQVRLRVRTEFAQTIDLGYFVQATRDTSDFQSLTTIGGARDSTRYEVLGGVRFELPVLMRGEVGVGYQNTDYRDARFRSLSGLAIDGNVAFFPTQLTTVTVSAQRRVNDAGTLVSSGFVALVAGVRVDHELLRQLIVSANVEYERDRFNGQDRRDRRWGLGASADYRLTPNLALRLAYDRLDLGSSGLDRYRSFQRNRVTVGLGLRV